MRTIILSEEQAQIFDEGFEQAGRIYDDCIELADRMNWDGPVVVQTIAGQVLFGLTPVARR